MICIHLRMGWYFEGVKFRRSVRIWQAVTDARMTGFDNLRWFCHILLHCHSKMAAGKWFIILTNKSGMFVIFCPFRKHSQATVPFSLDEVKLPCLRHGPWGKNYNWNIKKKLIISYRVKIYTWIATTLHGIVV